MTSVPPSDRQHMKELSPGGENRRGQWMALLAAILGWMFDGLEMGLFPLVARPALRDLLATPDGLPVDDAMVGHWFGVLIAGFLVGAAMGGVLFGWLGDRIGRVRAMTLSVLTYAIFTGLCGFAGSAEQVFGYRFVASLGMGGEWSLGVSLVMELWPNKSRGWLAGLIGAAANVGFMAIAIVGVALTDVLHSIEAGLLNIGLSEGAVAKLVANSGWRILMLFGAFPALLTFFIRLLVPESHRWLHEQGSGATSHWASRDLLGVLIGACGPLGMIYLWGADHSLAVRIVGSIVGLAIAVVGFTYPVRRYLKRAGTGAGLVSWGEGAVLGRMLVGAALSGVALLGTWASIQWAPNWADQLTQGQNPDAKAYTQFASGLGAILGTIVAATLGYKMSRRWMYCLLCAASLGSTLLFYRGNVEFNALFLATIFLAGACTASFYGWLPLYLPELFPTAVRATGQGFSFNFGRILAAVGALQTAVLMKDVFHDDYAMACSAMSLIYLVGLVVIWFAPETHGEPLPD